MAQLPTQRNTVASIHPVSEVTGERVKCSTISGISLLSATTRAVKSTMPVMTTERLRVVRTYVKGPLECSLMRPGFWGAESIWVAVGEALNSSRFVKQWIKLDGVTNLTHMGVERLDGSGGVDLDISGELTGPRSNSRRLAQVNGSVPAIRQLTVDICAVGLDSAARYGTQTSPSVPQRRVPRDESWGPAGTHLS